MSCTSGKRGTSSTRSKRPRTLNRSGNTLGKPASRLLLGNGSCATTAVTGDRIVVDLQTACYASRWKIDGYDALLSSLDSFSQRHSTELGGEHKVLWGRLTTGQRWEQRFRGGIYAVLEWPSKMDCVIVSRGQAPEAVRSLTAPRNLMLSLFGLVQILKAGRLDGPIWIDFMATPASVAAIWRQADSTC